VVEGFLASPEGQKHEYAKRFLETLSKAGKVMDFDAERIGREVSNETYVVLESHVKVLTHYFERARKARFGLRLVKDETA
jgi:hypothetical protein